ncbi:MAG: tetratricopeptide repeat-containing glycosyltransferase family protein [Bdellovibrionales bacterium]
MPSFSHDKRLAEAMALHGAGKLTEATRLYQSMLKDAPQTPEAIHMLGVIAQQSGNPAHALKLMEAALALKPDLAQAWSNRAIVLRALGRDDEALHSARMATDCDPKQADGWSARGSLARKLGDTKEAQSCLARAVELKPDDALILQESAQMEAFLGRYAKAFSHYQKAAKLRPDLPQLGLANLLAAAGYPERSLEPYRQAYETLPAQQKALARVGEGHALLRMGEMEAGLTALEARPDGDDRFRAVPLWQGEKVRHLLLHEDQGLGDVIFAARYLPLMTGRAEAITLVVASPLVQLMEAHHSSLEPQGCALTIQSVDRPVPASVEVRARMMSLPYFLKTTLATIPCAIPYLHATEEGRAVWRGWLAAKIPDQGLSGLGLPLVGLVWAGNRHNINDHNRSVPVDALEPLLQTGQGRIVALQREWNGAFPQACPNAGPELQDFAATAGLLAELDLLITVDTAAAHLAGAMGRPVWLLVPFDAEWRWLIGREDSPWYPSLRLFRQTAPQDWRGVTEQLATEMKRFLAGDKAVLVAKRWEGRPLRKNPLAISFPAH